VVPPGGLGKADKPAAWYLTGFPFRSRRASLPAINIKNNGNNYMFALWKRYRHAADGSLMLAVIATAC
jgi:hypothetical protein